MLSYLIRRCRHLWIGDAADEPRMLVHCLPAASSIPHAQTARSHVAIACQPSAICTHAFALSSITKFHALSACLTAGRAQAHCSDKTIQEQICLPHLPIRRCHRMALDLAKLLTNMCGFGLKANVAWKEHVDVDMWWMTRRVAECLELSYLLVSLLGEQRKKTIVFVAFLKKFNRKT